MRIGVLTLPLETNYGGILQAFALQKVLRDMGHDVYTIDRHTVPSYPSRFRQLVSFVKRNIQYLFLGKDVSTSWNPFITENEYKRISRNTQYFIDNNIKLTKKVASSTLWEIENTYKFDAYVVGSDQVWLPHYCPDSFLPFVHRNDVIKIVYAASCGENSFIEVDGLRQKCVRLSKEFQAFSCRELFLSEKAHKILGCKVDHVLDPTMLLKKEDYLSIIFLKSSKEPILFSYILDMSKMKSLIVDKISLYFKLNIINGNVDRYYRKGLGLNIEDCIFPSVDNWINGFNNAKFVVTDSFHGTVFSIIFNKQFIVIGNKKRGMDRFISLLNMFGLESRLVDNYEEALKLVNYPIDYCRVNAILEKEIIKSKDFLLNNL